MLLNPVDPSSFSPIDGFSPSRSLFKRCKTCDSVPTCPACPDGQTCTMTAQTCDSCATTKCVSASTNTVPPSDGPNVGAIAGGVVGGVIALAVILLLIWWFVVRKRRNAQAEEKDHSTFNAARDGRQSTQSIASTVLTRASNVIQIAYIPGVTNRSPPETPATLIPPVPPLPGAHPDQHFFMPGDLRDSSWTTMTGHQSMSPTLRSSVATTVYRSDAIVSATPAQQIQRSRANIVSVHNGPGGSGASTSTQPVPVMITPRDAPAVPAITSTQLAKAGALAQSGSSIVARQVMAKPVLVRGPSVKKKDGLTSVNTDADANKKPTTAGSDSSHQVDQQSSASDGNSSDEQGNETPATSSSDSTKAQSLSKIEESTPDAGPFQDHLSTPEANSSSVDQKRTSGHSHQTPPPRVRSPFSDDHEVK